MKKYLPGIIAVVIAIGFSAFTSQKSKAPTKKAFTSYYWFKVAPGDGDLTSLSNSNVTQYLGFSETIPLSDCMGSGHHCVVGFNADDVDIPNEQLKAGSHDIDSPGRPRGTQ